MKNIKTINKQSSKNNQKNMNISAWRDVYNWPVHKQEIVDNSWYKIHKDEEGLFEILWKIIISKLWNKWWVISGISLIFAWLVLFFTFFIQYFQEVITWSLLPNNLIFQSTNISWKAIAMLSQFSFEFFMAIFSLLITLVWHWCFRALKRKNQTECPKCKKSYSLEEVWEAKEKEVKTSQWFRVTQIRNYKCKNCSFEKESQGIFFIRND